jgi:hypothetical protein
MILYILNAALVGKDTDKGETEREFTDRPVDKENVEQDAEDFANIRTVQVVGDPPNNYQGHIKYVSKDQRIEDESKLSLFL